MQGDRCLIVKKIGSVKKVYTRYYFPVGKFKKNFRLIMLTKEKISHWHNDDGQLGRSTEKDTSENPFKLRKFDRFS